ncbi:hypothetical protein NBH81_18195 [Aeromonas veronii]|uniref:hypothetical protein n=1 Tax=Aeromonas veronii TaxID=654 RepID=UPI0021DAFEC9|nr:hypothetical protein [Aeromonas veronii]UYB70246.1 hypothetical protein NBH81_18195 [Aeromonas veronii]
MASPVLIGCRAVNAPKGKSDHSPKSDRQKSDRFLERVRQIANIQLKTIANNAQRDEHKNHNKINQLHQMQTTSIGSGAYKSDRFFA